MNKEKILKILNKFPSSKILVAIVVALILALIAYLVILLVGIK
ncbi:MAG: hypothetical protein PHE21_02780 [Candidatus Dojkabacteria bacterium]|nr:hypothetical protein [Candidatus Dojkabacteria bacterium]